MYLPLTYGMDWHKIEGGGSKVESMTNPNTTFVDSKEVTPQKKLVTFLDPNSYIPVPNLEALTGADIIISPDIGLPHPVNELWINKHVEAGCYLIQIKIGHDLPQSVVDDRIKDSLSKMLRIGAMPWQCILLFIGILSDSDEGALINKQHTYGDRKMTWDEIDIALDFWEIRGGRFRGMPSGKLLAKKLNNYQKIINKIVVDKQTERIFYPKTPAYYEETVIGTSIDPVTKEWFNAQNLGTVDDGRNAMKAFKNMGDERVKLIWDWMGENAALDMFIGSLYDRSILQVKGIGEGLWEDWVKWACNWPDEEIEKSRAIWKLRKKK